MKRSESGMIVNPITLSPTNRIYEALDLMRKYRHLRRAHHRERRQGRTAGRHPDEPRSAVRDQSRPPDRRHHDARPALHGAGRHDARAGARNPAPAQSREAARRRRPLHAERAHHRQGHPEAGQIPERVQGQPRPPPGRRRDRRRQRHARAGRGARRGARRRDRRRHRARPLAGGARHGAARPAPVSGRGSHRRERRDRRSDRGADRASGSTPSRSASARDRSARRGWSPGSASR